MCNFINFVLLGCEKHSQSTQKWPKNSRFRHFLNLAKTVHSIRTKISTVIFYTIVWSMCAISIWRLRTEIPYNWDWSESEGKRLTPTPLPHMRLWFGLRFFCFFLFLPTFHENFKFLKNCPYDFHEILHSRSTPKGAPACAMASKSYDCNVTNIAT